MSSSSEPQTQVKTFDVKILRQDHPSDEPYWQVFRLDYQPGLNITSVLQKISARPTTVDDEQVTPVAYDANCLEEVCGSCTMRINGTVRQACSALVDRLLEDHPDVIELRPMSKFPVLRDLFVDRQRLFRALEKLSCWIPVDTYSDMGRGPKQSQEQQELAYPLSECMSCGCCLEACPQYQKVDPTRRDDESEEDFELRRDAEFDENFIGAAAMSQAVLMNSHPTGAMMSRGRLDALIAPGGIENCGKAGNCQAVCPKKIPLMHSWGRVQRAATVHVIKEFFDGGS